MQLSHISTVLEPQENILKVTALSFSPDGRKLAVCTINRVVLLFDENGEKQDKFSTKPAQKDGPKTFIVRGLKWSPDSTKLAIAQSDNIVFVYKLGYEWKSKKSICNKFMQSNPVTCITWPKSRNSDVVIGLSSGKVKVGQLSTNRSATLYNAEHYCTALASNPEGTAIVSAHLDGSIYRYYFEDSGGTIPQACIAQHSSVPFALAWAQSICVAGNDQQVVFYDPDGGVERSFDYSNNDKCKEFTIGINDPSGENVILGNYNSLYVYSLDKTTQTWEEASIKDVENMYTVSALDWKSDGSRIGVGTLCGVVDLFDACLKRYRYKGKFEITYVSSSQIIIRNLSTDSSVSVKSYFGCEITKINIYQDRYVVANTTETLLLGDLDIFKVSEIQWHSDIGEEKYIFDNPSVCIVSLAGEVSLIEYGENEILGSIRTDNINSHLLSVRIEEREPRSGPDNPDTPRRDNEYGNKKVAYLLDAQTINIKDLITNASTNITHDSKIDWLELNGRANLLLFRDRRRQLYLFDLDTQERSTLLNYCTYVQWVPDSDVVVAQNRNNLCVWYNIHSHEQITVHQINGDIEEIERGNGKTQVIVDEGFEKMYYELDEPLIVFGTAIDDRNYTKAMDILDTLELTPESEAMWNQLLDMTLANGDLGIAERCAAALGDVAKCRYLHKVNKLSIELEEKGMDPDDHWQIRSRVALMQKNIRQAEDILVSMDRVDEAINMYQQLHRFNQAVRVAEINHHPDANNMRKSYFQYLLDNRMETEAAALREEEREYNEAINLYLKGRQPGRAAKVILDHHISQPASLLENVASALIKSNIYDKAGELYEEMGQNQRALDAYINGNVWKNAVDIARRHYKGRVVELQEEWGDYLVSQNQIDMAIFHYIEAGARIKAIEAALNSRQWSNAADLVVGIEEDKAKPYYRRLAKHYEEVKRLDQAERFYILAGNPESAVEMYTRHHKLEMAHKLAVNYMSDEEASLLYINQAQRMQDQNKLKEAEKLYLAVDEVDLAINMYRQKKKYDSMVRLVSQHRRELLKETHQFLAQQLEMDGNLKEAEHHYVEAGEWASAVNMYRSNDMWDDAIRVAKVYGGVSAVKRVACGCSMALGIDIGGKMLAKMGLIEAAMDYAIDSGAFDHAFDLARQYLSKKIPDVHLKHALYLEEEERYKDAEEEFINANKPKEAIDMYTHIQEWDNAIRVAELYDPSSVSDVCIAQAKYLSEQGSYNKAEDLYITAGKPDHAIDMYKVAGRWEDALRIAQRHLPHRVGEINTEKMRDEAKRGTGGGKADYISAGRNCEQVGQYENAIDSYLRARPDVISNKHDLEEIWLMAVRVARERLKSRYPSVVEEVSKRLAEINLYDTAADVLAEANRIEDAVDIALDGNQFDKARELATGNHDLIEKVERIRHDRFKEGENIDQLMNIGEIESALEVLAKRGEWDKLWKTVKKSKVPEDIETRFAIGQIEDALNSSNNSTLLNNIVPILFNHCPAIEEKDIRILEKYTKTIFSRTEEEEEKNDQDQIILDLRVALYQIANNFRRNNGFMDKTLEEILMATHYASMYVVCKQNDLKDLQCKISITLLRYPNVIPIDKAFYLAGMSCRETNANELAFLLLSRYVDLIDAIEEDDSSLLDNSDLSDCNNIPFSTNLPKKHYLETDKSEDVRDWILSVCMDHSKSEQGIPPQYESIGTVYEGLYQSDLPICIVTGYPIQNRELFEINHSTANKNDWNRVVSVTRTDPWTGKTENPRY